MSVRVREGRGLLLPRERVIPVRYGDGTATWRVYVGLYVVGIQILTQRAWHALTGR